MKSKKSIKQLLEFGIINIDKSSGPTSFNISDFIRKKLKLRKTSHFGTLDPKVTGVLPIALNRACKLTGHFLGHDKEYIGIMRIHDEMNMQDIQKVIDKKFLGVIKQTPPVKSRVKRQEREREIKQFKLLEQNGKDIVFLAEVQGGTYIRKLLDDLGKELNIGAHMLELRRIRAGIFSENKSTNLYDFQKAVDEYEKGDEKLLRDIITPGEIIREIYPTVQVKQDSLTDLFNGKPVKPENLVKKQELETDSLFVAFSDKRFIGIYKVLNDEFAFAKAEFVMQVLE